jgi:hypothetical protein
MPETQNLADRAFDSVGYSVADHVSWRNGQPRLRVIAVAELLAINWFAPRHQGNTHGTSDICPHDYRASNSKINCCIRLVKAGGATCASW